MEQEDGKFTIPLEDIEIILCIGAKIRFSTMGLGEINQAGIIVVGFGKKHEPQTIIQPFFFKSKAYVFLEKQINLKDDFKKKLWNKIIKEKILNSARNLAILGLDGFEKISNFASPCGKYKEKL